MLIEGRSAFITGAGNGIGRATARALAKKGARRLTLCDLDESGLRETAELVTADGAVAVSRVLNVTDSIALERALAETDGDGGLDIVFNNAGIVAGHPDFPDTTAERISRVMSVNLAAVVIGTSLAVRLMRVRGGGVIINTASIGGIRPGLADAPYRASKAGVVMFTQCCKALVEHGIRVNAVLPGITETAILDRVGDDKGRPAWLLSILQRITVLKPEAIADGVLSLIEDDGKAGELLILANELRTEPAG